MIPVWILLLSEEEQNKLGKLYEGFSKQMAAAAAKILKTPEDIEDAVSDAFIKIADNMDKLENRSLRDVQAFCIVVVKNAAKDMRRKNNKRYAVFTDLNEDITPAPVNIIEQYELQEIRRYLLKLPEDLKEAIWLHYFMDISVKDIAKIQHVKSVTVYKRINRGQYLLLKMLEADDKNAD